MLVGGMRHKEIIMMALQTRQIGLTTTVSGVEGGGGEAKYQNIERDLFVSKEEGGIFQAYFLRGGEH